jgi:trehalose/maltose hydrolase-like predicted phosphorylase
VLSYRGWDPEAEGLRETPCTLGNGYQGVRGYFPGCRADSVHYPGVYVAGCYDRAITSLVGQSMAHESLANLPNWLVVRFRPVGGQWLSPQTCRPLDYDQQLDVRVGMLGRDARFVDAEGRRTRLAERRLVHMGDPHLAALELSIVAENWAGPVEIESGLDGSVANTGVRSDLGFNAQHLCESIFSVFECYLTRTSHGSTLSRVVDAWILARADREASWQCFLEATVADIADTQGGTTAEGVHLAASLDMVQRCYTGLEVRDDQLWLNPLLPTEVPELSLQLLCRGHWLRLIVARHDVDIQSAPSTAPTIRVRVGERVIVVAANRAVNAQVRHR